MEFNPGDGTGVVDEINDICNSDDQAYPLLSKARRVNSALDKFFSLAFQADGRWDYDDPNWGTTPIQSQDLVANQQVYDIGGFTSEVLDILRVEILDSGGTPQLMNRLKRENVRGALTNYQPTGNSPLEYDLVGTSIYLYPKPNYNKTNGLTFYIARNKSPFTDADTTKVLPVPSVFVTYICQVASLPYLIERQKVHKNDVATLITETEADIKAFYFAREKGVNKSMKAGFQDNR